MDLRTTAPAPILEIVFRFSREEVSPELPTIIGFFNCNPRYLHERSAIVLFF
jgi:hypothetical protein